MPPDPNQLLAQANAASAQADAKVDAARKMHAEADLAGQFLESVLAGQSPQMWTGGAARTIRVLVLPTCRRIADGKGEHLVAALVDAAYEEVLDWAVGEGWATR